MPKFYLLCFIFLSQGTMAREERLHVSTPAPGLFHGSIQRLEPEIKHRLIKAAQKSCGSDEAIISIFDVRVSFSFDAISQIGSNFSGSYPVAEAEALVHCQE